MPDRSAATPAPDSLATAAAIGVLAYVSADVAHHVAGHGGACRALGGHIELITSVYARCSCKSAWVDLAGPLANLLLGAGALGAVRFRPQLSGAARLFLVQAAGFNLFYFAGQLVFDMLVRTDDWAWPLRYFRVPEPLRYGLLAAGLGAYGQTVRLLGRQLAPFARPRARATGLVGSAWAAAGLVACATAALDHPAGRAVLYHAIPQALLLPLGLWALPARAARGPASHHAPPLAFSAPWVVGAVVVAVASVWVLGPGFGTAALFPLGAWGRAPARPQGSGLGLE